MTILILIATIVIVITAVQITQQRLQEILEGREGPRIDFHVRLGPVWYGRKRSGGFGVAFHGCGIPTATPDPRGIAGDLSKIAHNAWHPVPPVERHIDETVVDVAIVAVFVIIVIDHGIAISIVTDVSVPLRP